jgi:hypothetical protein
VDRLALVCTSYRGVGPEPISLQALGRMLGWGSLNSEDAVHRSLETAISNAYRESNPEEFGLILRWCLADSSSLSDYSQQVMAGARFEASCHAGDMTFPTLVIHGAEERYILVANAVALAEAVPDAELRVIEDAGHLVSIEQSEEVNEEVISFLKPGLAWRFQMPAARQKTSKLVERVEGTNERLVSLLKIRDPQTEEGLQGALQEVVKNYTFGKLERWLRRQSRVPGGWARKLRGGLSR